MGRIADWIGSQSAGRRYRRLEREARELLLEVTDALEKLNTMAARLAKREARARRAAENAPVTDDQQLSLVPPRGAGNGSHKAQLRARVAALAGLPTPRPSPMQLPKPCTDCDDNAPEGV